MNVLTAALLGLIQGLAEFLPISSSGHLNLLQALFGVDVEHQLLFNILLHVGTLVTVAIVFWKDWVAMIAHPIKTKRCFCSSSPRCPRWRGRSFSTSPSTMSRRTIASWACAS